MTPFRGNILCTVSVEKYTLKSLLLSEGEYNTDGVGQKSLLIPIICLGESLNDAWQ
jgi:hypothetical protein